MKEALEVINKYGITAVMAIAILWFNSRLNSVEDKLYDCYQQRINNNFKVSSEDYNYIRPLAVLPTEIKIKKDDRK